MYTEPFMLRGTLTFYSQILVTMLLGLMLGRARFFQNSGQLPAAGEARAVVGAGRRPRGRRGVRRLAGDHHGLRDADAVAHHRRAPATSCAVS